MKRTRTTITVAAVVGAGVALLLTGCAAGAGKPSCSDAMTSLSKAGVEVKASMDATGDRWANGDVADPAQSETVAREFTKSSGDMDEVADRLEDLGSVSSGKVASSARDASKKWTIAANDYRDLADAMSGQDISRMNSLASTAASDLDDSNEALQSVIAELEAQGGTCK